MKVADKFGLFAILKTRAKCLTLAEKRRVSLTRILMREAKLILIDDFLSDLPTSEADALFDEVTRVLFDLAKENGTTVIFATDNPRYAFAFGDKTMVLVGGEIKQIGTHKDMWQTPTTVWSAKAVDPCFNTIKGTLSFENDRLTFVSSPLNQTFSLDEDGKVVWQDADLYKTISIDVTEMKDDILPDFIGKEILLGWHGNEFIFTDDGIPLNITFVKKQGDKIVIVGDYDYEEIKVVVDNTFDYKNTTRIEVLPELANLLFFTITENSIMKRKRP